jgi:hypothetical protein
MFEVDRIAVVIKPTVKMLEWLNTVSVQEETRILQHLRRDCMVLLIPEFDGPRQATEYIKTIFSPILEAELIAWDVPKHLWPEHRDLELFKSWFDIEFHSMIYDIAYLEDMAQLHVSKT